MINHILLYTPVIKEKVDYEKFLPSPSDIMALKKNLAVIVSHNNILVENIPALQRFGSGIKKHIDHEWSKEMAKKSVVVSDNYAINVLVYVLEVFHYTSQIPLGVILKSENKMDEMCEIMECMQQYVPHVQASHDFVNQSQTM